MLKKKSALVAVVVLGTACQVEFSSGRVEHHTSGDLPAAQQAVWNPGPGDMDALQVATRRAAVQTPAADDDPSIAPAGPNLAGPGVDPTATKRTLVLFDHGGQWGALGELYAIGAANLASHFGSWTAKQATAYVCGELNSYDATIYLGSTYDEPLPTCLLDDVLNTTKPVVWSFYNLWQLTNRAGASFATNYGWMWTGLDFSAIDRVDYKNHSLTRYAANGGGVMNATVTDSTKATVLATAYRTDGTTLPWAIRSRNLTYVGDLPFTYMKEEDRYLAFADLLFDALAPATPERHRVVLRIEDISPVEDPASLRAIADYLYSQGVPFGFGVIAEYRDPLGHYNGGVAETVKLQGAPDTVSALKYMATKGGVSVMHGYTHQYKTLLNPYTAVSGDDYEFYRVTEDTTTHLLTYVGPVTNDTQKATKDAIAAAKTDFSKAKLPSPTIFEFPHYAGSANAYKGTASVFTTRWERSLYFPGTLNGGTVSYQWMFGQMFPYTVRDVYGTRVLPENLGNIEPEPFYIYPTRFPADIVNAAEKNLVVRDGVAGFYFHPFFDLQYLKDTVTGLKALGYEFVSPNSL